MSPDSPGFADSGVSKDVAIFFGLFGYFDGQHSGAVASTAASQQESPGFESSWVPVWV